MPQNHNYLQTYDTAIAALNASPDSPVLQHRAVLALARAGALDFAWAEYGRYGLSEVTQHPDAKLLEDIMALKGRLLKDMALRASGEERTKLARRSVTAYARAFKATGGYYAGINVAAMSLLGGRSERTVASKANDVLDILPNEKAQIPEDTYYIEATRAECLLLMGHKNKAGEMLQGALMHDPLNYTAHATTFKQFSMIMAARDESTEWLEPFTPPTAIHFAGHIFASEAGATNYLDDTAQENLREAISDQIQRHDIGFGYGALAAGSDILIAEALLDEGAELHVVLPAPVDQFIATSVSPFGAAWDARFDKCLTQASSIRICSVSDTSWPSKNSVQYASQCAMGQAVMRADTLFSRAAQLLIWDADSIHSATGADALSWRETRRQQTIIPYPGKRDIQQIPVDDEHQTLLAVLYVDLKELQADQDGVSDALDIARKCCAHAPSPLLFQPIQTGLLIGFERVGNAARCARNILKHLKEKFPDKAIYIVGHYVSVKDPQNPCPTLVQYVQDIAAVNMPDEIYTSEAFAALLASHHAADFAAEYVGTRKLENMGTEIRVFHLV